jgi:hypothetical protein
MLMFKPDAGHSRYETPILIRPKLPRLLRKTSTPSPIRSEEDKGGQSRCKELIAKEFMRPMMLRATPALYLEEVSSQYSQLYGLKAKVSPQLHQYTRKGSRNKRDKRSLKGGVLERYEQLGHADESAETTTPGRHRRDSSSKPRRMMKSRQFSLESGLVVEGREAHYAKAVDIRLKRRVVMVSRGNQVHSRGDLGKGKEAQSNKARMNLRLKRPVVMESRGNQADSRETW